MIPKPVKLGLNTTVIPCGYVDPNKLSNTQVGPGKYSLNKRSNVPFVGLVGSAGFRKVISWGEIAEVPAGQLVTVSNASYHGGDIFINKGPDMCNKPSRITVPVEYETGLEVSAGLFYWTAKFPCDVRSCSRAYLVMDAFSNEDPPTQSAYAVVRGRRVDGSMKTKNQLSLLPDPFGPGVGYFDVQPMAANTAIVLPLGKNAAQGDDTRPHLLLDNADAFFYSDASFADFTWPIQAIPNFASTGNTTFPSTWYVVEY